MERIRSQDDDLPLLPERVRHFLWRKSLELAGLAIVAATVVAALALASWSIDDPSLNHAVERAPDNLLGYAGAVFADLMMQLFGFAAIAALLPPFAWGSLMISRGMIERFRWRPAMWLAGCVLAAGLAATLPVPAAWPLPTGLGGLLGDVVAGAVGAPFRALLISDAIANAVTGLMLLAASSAVLARSCAFTLDDIERTGRYLNSEGGEMAARSLGALAHTVLRLRALFRRWRDPAALHHVDDSWLDRREEPDWEADALRLRPRLLARLRRAVHDTVFGEDPGAGPADPGRIEPAFGAPAGAAEMPGDPAGGLSDAAAPAPKTAPARPARRRTPPQPGDFSECDLPPLSLLAQPRQRGAGQGLGPEDLDANARRLESVLDDFGVRGEILNVRPGPVITLYELEPAPGIKSSRVIGLADDIARSMSAISARVAVVPGRNVIGIELPNPRREMVYLRELLESEAFRDPGPDLPLALGKDIGGGPVIGDLSGMPHLLIAGTTGSGKSVGINTMILSLLYRLPPDQCRFIMIDPKMLELSVYDGIPHLLAPVVTDPKKAVVALKWTVREMEERYQKMSKLGVRNIAGFNERVLEAAARGEPIVRTVQTGFDENTGEPVHEREKLELAPMPYIVVIVDEMADLMMVAGKEIEGAVQRLAQMARAAGIHLITATQRPSVDVITGTIKANFPTRISFQVTSKIDSRTILGEQGADQLLGRGDMLFMAGGGRIGRVHGPFVSDAEVEKVVRFLKKQGVPDYVEEVTVEPDDGGFDGAAGFGGDSDDLYGQAVSIVLRDRKASTSYIQRRLSIGYNRAASIIERMEEEGVIGPANHAGKREILLGEAS